ncbi:hypothetical protein SAMN05660657_05660 [Geodermatophilus amargosae]|uniref:Uncharacterized protein n=1 Tax=Geodermatophilus amargosae TaxID=1296565 RepID=A0A1I7DDZ1_9ACTN|nr:hypothetical protein SAMN05660657_05660 [Geodermatophilus amargosae]
MCSARNVELVRAIGAAHVIHFTAAVSGSLVQVHRPAAVVPGGDEPLDGGE